MVDSTDLKFYGSIESGDTGGAIDTGDAIQTSTPNNLFPSFSRSQIVSGTTKYKCFFLKNESSEDMENFKIWISNGTPLDNTNIAMAFDSQANPINGSVGFDGVDDYMDCTNDATLWSKALTKFSFAVIIYPTASGDGNDRVVVSHGGSSNNGFRLIIDQTTSTNIKFLIKDNSGVTHTVTSTNLVRNAWNKVFCSYDNTLGSDNQRIYCNGVAGTTSSWVGSINISAALTLSEDSNDFKGYLRDFKFWDDQSINTTEADELYEDDELANSTPAYHLPLNERTGDAKDAVTKTKVATRTNGAFWKLNAQTIADTFTSPDILDTWYTADEKPPAFKLGAGQTTPIWVRVEVEPDSTATPYENDSGVFTINFDIPATGTGSGGSGGSGGGTGGSTGGSGTTDYKIAIAGDWGNTSNTTKVVDLLKSQNYDLIIGVGDNAYDDSSASSWCSKFNTFKSKMISAYGNHEYEDGPISTYKSFFGDSKTYYSHRFQNCLILILDSNDDKSGVDLDAQRTWAKGELEKYKNDTNVVWRIAVMHHPWFGEGARHEENEFDQVQKFHKLFTDYDVNFVYTGHNHHWQRSHQCSYNSSTPKEPNVVDSSSPYTRTGNGLIHIVSGTGGHDGTGELYSLSDDAPFWAYRNKSNNGVHELVASNSGKTLTGRFRSTSNNTSDTFQITA